ncbi:unnamed protein product [Parajaminaea phylloscopi]
MPAVISTWRHDHAALSPEEQAVASWTPALVEGSSQTDFSSPLNDAPLIVVAGLALTLVLAAPRLLRGVSMLLVAASLCFCLSTVFELIRGTARLDKHGHETPRALALSYLSALPQSLGSFAVCLWLALFQISPLADFCQLRLGLMTPGDLKLDRLDVNDSCAYARRVGPLGIRRLHLIAAPILYGICELISRLVFVQNGRHARIGWLVGTGAVFALVIFRLLECFISSHHAVSAHQGKTKLKVFVCQMTVVGNFVGLLLGQLSLALLNCFYLAGSEPPLGRDSRAIHLLSALILSAATDKCASMLRKQTCSDQGAEWPPAYTEQPMGLLEEPAATHWTATPTMPATPTADTFEGAAAAAERARAEDHTSVRPDQNDSTTASRGEHTQSRLGTVTEVREPESEDTETSSTPRRSTSTAGASDSSSSLTIIAALQHHDLLSQVAPCKEDDDNDDASKVTHHGTSVRPSTKVSWCLHDSAESSRSSLGAEPSSSSSSSLLTRVQSRPVSPAQLRRSRVGSLCSERTHVTVTSFFNALNTSLSRGLANLEHATKGWNQDQQPGGRTLTSSETYNFLTSSPLRRPGSHISTEAAGTGSDEATSTVIRSSGLWLTSLAGSALPFFRSNTEPCVSQLATPSPSPSPWSNTCVTSTRQRISSPLRRCLWPHRSNHSSMTSEADVLYFTATEGGPVQALRVPPRSASRTAQFTQ